LQSEWLPVGIITLLAFILRIANIGTHSFWVDEYLHVLPAWDFISGNGLNHIDGSNGIFTTWIEVVFLFIFGKSELAARLPMVLFSTATVPILYIFTKRLFNRDIALLSILFFTLSLFSIYWGRVVRNYAAFLPFFLMVHLLFIQIFEPEKGWINRKTSFAVKPIILLLLAIILAFSNHTLTLFWGFALLLFGSILWVIQLIKAEGKQRFLNKYSLFPPLFVGFAFMWHPGFGKIIVKLLGILLPKNIVDFQTPNLQRLLDLFEKKPYEAFNVYWGVIETDMLFLHLIGFVGLILGIIKFNKHGLYVAIQFLFTLFLISFVFRDAALPRYLYFIYPFLLIGAATTLWWATTWIKSKLSKKQDKRLSFVNYMVLGIIVIILAKPQETKAYLSKTHGLLVDRKLSEWFYTNWKESGKYVKQNMKENDVVLSTIPNAQRVYLDIDTAKIGWFRQMRYDGLQKKYVQNEPLGKTVSGYTTEEFIATVENHNRGWLIADYYFYNVMTDDKARQYAIENLRYHYNASTDGSVHVFSWDKSNPKEMETPLMIELGKPLGSFRFESSELPFNINKQAGVDAYKFVFDVEGLVNEQELVVQINDAQVFYIPKPTEGKGWGTEFSVLEVPASALVEGQNKMKFVYNSELNLPRPGVAIYNVRMF
jgi:4-amino-4-deoxy-L-arabinose transferase-like glycosyltransferase